MNFSKIILPLILFANVIANAAVWKDTNKWNEQWEEKYSQWIENAVTKDIFTQGKWKDMKTDCADAVYFLRAIFAYENSLPFVMQSEKVGIITNRNTIADNLTDADEKVRVFLLKIVGDYGGTKSLARDTYPIAINRDNIMPGTVWLREPTHAELVQSLDSTGVLHMIGSTLPGQIRELITKTDLVSHPFDAELHGLRRWKHPDQISLDASTLPGYSLEQFNFVRIRGEQDDLLDTNSALSVEWKKIVQNKLALSKEDIQSASKRLVQDICDQLLVRNDITTKGEAYKLQNPGCMNEKAFDDYSTPGRDEVIRNMMYNLARMKSDKMSSLAAKADTIAGDLAACGEIKISDTQSVLASDFAKKILTNQISTNPNDSVLARWGLAPRYSTELSRKCPESFQKESDEVVMPGE